MLIKLESLKGTKAQNQMLAISEYLIGKDGQGGELSTILTALKKKDEQNIANGKPTQYFDTFTRTVRDFSPDVARRVDIFIDSYETEAPKDGQPASPYQRAIIQG